jgi:hemerythrin-like domain-containing protein
MSRPENALEMLRRDHRDMQAMFHRFDKASEKEQDKLCREMLAALEIHTRIEEEVFYPYVREATARDDLIEVASVEHGTAKQLVGELASGVDGLRRQAVVHALREYLGHHMREEEQQIFPVVEKLGVDLEALGEEMLAFGGAMLTQPAGQVGAEAATGCRPHSREEDEAFRKTFVNQLSRSTQRAKWIYTPDEHEDFHGQTLATRNPEVIQHWAEERKAKPATIPDADAERPRVLRLDFPGYAEDLQPVSWGAWCAVFERRQVAFLFQEHLKSGRRSNFFAFDSPFREDG